MRLVTQGVQMFRSRPRRQDILSLRHTRPRINGLCLECRKEIPFIQLRHRPAGLFSFGLLDGLHVRLRRPHVREAPPGFGLERLATAFMHRPG